MSQELKVMNVGAKKMSGGTRYGRKTMSEVPNPAKTMSEELPLV